MASFSERRDSLGRFGVLWAAILLAGLLLASVWDGDGNPNTDNLPQCVASVKVRSVADAEQRIEDSDEDNGPPERDGRFRWLRRLPVIGHEWRWRPLAVPRRGP